MHQSKLFKEVSLSKVQGEIDRHRQYSLVTLPIVPHRVLMTRQVLMTQVIMHDRFYSVPQARWHRFMSLSLIIPFTQRPAARLGQLLFGVIVP